MNNKKEQIDFIELSEETNLDKNSSVVNNPLLDLRDGAFYLQKKRKGGPIQDDYYNQLNSFLKEYFPNYNSDNIGNIKNKKDEFIKKLKESIPLLKDYQIDFNYRYEVVRDTFPSPPNDNRLLIYKGIDNKFLCFINILNNKNCGYILGDKNEKEIYNLVGKIDFSYDFIFVFTLNKNETENDENKRLIFGIQK